MTLSFKMNKLLSNSSSSNKSTNAQDAKTTTSTSSSSAAANTNANAPPKTKSCTPCAQLLQQVMLNSPRPRLLLQSLGMTENIRWRPTADGLEVEIPAEDLTKPKRTWRQLQISQQQQQQEENSNRNSSSSVSVNTAKQQQPQSNTTTTKTKTSLMSRPFQMARRLTAQLATSSNARDRNRAAVSPAPLPSSTRNEEHTIAFSKEPSSSSSGREQAKETEWLSISCRSCSDVGPEGNARAFVMGPTPLSVVVCTNRLQSTQPSAASATTSAAQQTEKKVAEMEEILVHELTHVYDVRQLQLDLRDCPTLAYSEVRAAQFAECYDAPATATSRANVRWGARSNSSSSNNNRNVCVQQKAMTATHNLFSRQARDCVQTVLDSAMQDARPFATMPTPPAPPQPVAAPVKPRVSTTSHLASYLFPHMATTTTATTTMKTTFNSNTSTASSSFSSPSWNVPSGR